MDTSFMRAFRYPGHYNYFPLDRDVNNKLYGDASVRYDGVSMIRGIEPKTCFGKYKVT